MTLSKPVQALLVLVVVAGFLLLVFWGASDPTPSTPANQEIPTAPAVSTKAIAPPSTGSLSSSLETPTPLPATSVPLPSSGALASDQADEAIANLLLDDSISHEQAASRLLELLPRLPADQQEEAAHHISNLSEDTQAADYARRLINNSLPPPAAEVFFSDLMNRPHELLLPTLSQIADQPNHPQKQDSIDVLEVLYGTPENGLNWQSWIALQLTAENSPNAP